MSENHDRTVHSLQNALEDSETRRNVLMDKLKEAQATLQVCSAIIESTLFHGLLHLLLILNHVLCLLWLWVVFLEYILLGG